jgi:hypothetical protein
LAYSPAEATMTDDDDGAAIRRLKLNDIRDVIKEKTRRLSC